MFKQIKNLIAKNFSGGNELFSNLSILPFSKYQKNYARSDYLSSYQISLYANRGITKRAEKVSEIEFTLSINGEEQEESEILDLLNKPSSVFTGNEFWGLYQKYLDIFGEAYIELDRETKVDGSIKINEMRLLRSDLVKPFFSKETGELLFIEFKTSEGTDRIKGENVIYAHSPSPSDPLRGEPLMQAGIRQVETATQIDEYHSKILENGGRVEGIMSIKNSGLTKTQLTELKEKYQEEYGNASKAGLPMFLSGETKFERLGLDPAELAYLETKRVNLNDIVIMTGVPLAILGVTSEETFSNADAAIRIFLRETIKPLMESLTANLNENLVSDFGEGYELGFIDPTPENREENRKDLETADSVHALTTNEKRERIGLDPIDESGNEILVPMNLVPLSATASEVESTEEKSLQKGCGCGNHKKELKSPACRMKNETEVDCVSRKVPELMSEGMSQAQAIAAAKSMCKNKCKGINHPLSNKEIRRIYHSLCVKRLDRRQERMKRIIELYFEGQKERIIDKLKSRKQFKVKGLLDELFYDALEIKLAQETVLPILESLMKEAAEDSKEIAGSDWDFQDTPEINSWLDKKTKVFAEQINETTFDKLKREFSESFSEGESRLALIKRIEDTYGEISKSRAETIARTEVHGVTQFGTMQGYKQADLPIKIWVWAPGTKGGIREDHQAMDGETVPIDQAFSNGLMFPGDPSGGAEENINCQCFI